MMDNEQYELIAECKEIMTENGVNGVQFMAFSNGIATFEALGTAKDEYINYTVDIDGAIETGEIEFKLVNVSVEEYDEMEIDITVNEFTFDEDMEETNFQDELVKTYKRLGSALKRAYKIADHTRGANVRHIILG